jgi:hypothetical protein
LRITSLVKNMFSPRTTVDGPQVVHGLLVVSWSTDHGPQSTYGTQLIGLSVTAEHSRFSPPGNFRFSILDFRIRFPRKQLNTGRRPMFSPKSMKIGCQTQRPIAWIKLLSLRLPRLLFFFHPPLSSEQHLPYPSYALQVPLR